MSEESESRKWISHLLAANAITGANLVRWERGLAFLSMERCVPFFKEVGIPARIVAKPESVVFSASEYWHEMGNVGSSYDATVENARTRVVSFLENITRSYDQVTTRALADWLLRYVVDDGLTDAASAWRSVLRHICNLTTENDFHASGLLDDQLVARVCQIVADLLHPGVLHEMEERLKAARALPETAWEHFMNQRVANSAGQYSSLSATDMALDSAGLASITNRTLRLWGQLKKQLTSTELNQLVQWASNQSGKFPAITRMDAYLN